MSSACASWSVILVLGVVGCGFGFHSGPDRPDEASSLGPPPPPSFHCERGRAYREKGRESSQPDHVYFAISGGKPICDGLDFDHDGVTDEWDLLDDKGRIVDRAPVTNQSPARSLDAGTDSAP